MPPKKAKKNDKGGKPPPKRVTRAEAAKEKADAADGAAVKDGSKKPAAKPAKPTTPAKKTTSPTGAKRKRADEEVEEADEDSPPRTRNPKKPKLSPKTARRVKLLSYLENRTKDLGFKVEPSKHHEPDDEDEDEPDEDWASMQRLRQRCDDRLDDIEEAIRTIGREFYSDLDIPERKSDETRHEKRQKDEDIQDDQEINPIAEKKRVKVSKNFPNGRKYRSAKQLGDLVKQLERQLGDELKNRKVQHPHDVSLAKYPSKRVRKAREAAKAKGEPPKLTRTLDKQWDKHGLTLRELLDLYNRQGEQTPAPARDDLVKKCQKYGLSTVGDLWDLEKAILMYELASKQRMYGLSQEAINSVISALGAIKAPIDSDEEADDGGDDSDDAGGSFEDLKTGGKGKAASKDGKKEASASPKGGKEGGKGAEVSPKVGKKDGAAKYGSKDGKKDGKTDCKKDDKDAGANKKGKKRGTRSDKGMDPAAEDVKLINQDEITVTEDGQSQRFTQLNVEGTGNRCMWHAVQYHWLGRQRAARRIAQAYPVHERVRELWDAVMNPTEGTTNPARQSRQALYTSLQQHSQDARGGHLQRRVYNRQWGDLDMLQLVADALDVEIFVYSPVHSEDGTITWHRYVRGVQQNDPARQFHLASYMHAWGGHWTALTPVGAGPVTLPALGPEHRDPSSGMGIAAPPLTRLAIGDENNTDLRAEEQHDTPEDGHVADTTEVDEEEEDVDEEEDEDENPEDDEEEDDVGGDGGPPPPPPPAAGAAITTVSSAAARRSSSAGSQPSRKPSRSSSLSRSKSRNTSQPSGVQKNIQPPHPLSKKALKGRKDFRKICHNFFVAMPSPQNMGGAIKSPYLRSVVAGA
ncbi:hypothetical protein E4T48_01564 [Aureobasidium sp. EXF-10727]|nr:hypothetical protein E4T48_01564 [Aureobasidium sp. EXF-10727]